jgi:3-methylcrotonyl-CoA carboxylase alpha subunit
VEARIYAEDPVNDFLPSSGPVLHFFCTSAEAGPESGLRLDAGLESGDMVSSFYDPMIAKIIAWGEDRVGALARLEEGLKGCRLLGPANNLSFLRRLIGHIAKMPGPADTSSLQKLAPEVVEDLRALDAEEPDPQHLALLAFGDLLSEGLGAAVDGIVSPWDRRDAWRAGGRGRIYRDYAKGSVAEDGLMTLAILPQDAGHQIELADGTCLLAEGSLSADGCLRASLDDQSYQTTFLTFGDLRALFVDGDLLRLHAPDWLALAPTSGPGGGRVLAPLSGRIVAVKVEPGETVSAGMPLIILEAMKMEHAISASRDGRVSELAVSAGDQVEEGSELLLMEEVDPHAAIAPEGSIPGESLPSDL